VRFRLRDGCPLWCAVPHASTTTRLCNFRRAGHDSDQTSYNPRHATRDHLFRTLSTRLTNGSSLFHFRSPLGPTVAGQCRLWTLSGRGSGFPTSSPRYAAVDLTSLLSEWFRQSLLNPWRRTESSSPRYHRLAIGDPLRYLGLLTTTLSE
jgi:hypothetical protein